MSLYVVTKHNKIYCTVLYSMLHNYMFWPYIRPSSGCIRLALRVMYPDDKVYYFDKLHGYTVHQTMLKTFITN